MFELSPIAKEDYPQWLQLWEGYLKFYKAELSEEITENTFNRILTGEIHGVIAKNQSGKALGIVHWLTHNSTWSVEPVCYLEDLFVDPDSRMSGIGRKLIHHVEDWATSAGINKVYWLTAETNETARALYDKLANRTGFIHYEIREKK